MLLGPFTIGGTFCGMSPWAGGTDHRWQVKLMFITILDWLTLLAHQ